MNQTFPDFLLAYYLNVSFKSQLLSTSLVPTLQLKGTRRKGTQSPLRKMVRSRNVLAASSLHLILQGFCWRVRSDVHWFLRKCPGPIEMLAAFGEVHFKNQSPSFYTIGLVYSRQRIYGIIWCSWNKVSKRIWSKPQRPFLYSVSTASRQHLAKCDNQSRGIVNQWELFVPLLPHGGVLHQFAHEVCHICPCSLTCWENAANKVFMKLILGHFSIYQKFWTHSTPLDALVHQLRPKKFRSSHVVIVRG